MMLLTRKVLSIKGSSNKKHISITPLAHNSSLIALNHDLRNKVAELIRSNDNFSSLFDNFNIPVLVLDNNLKIRQFNPATTRLFHIHQSSTGRAIQRITHNFKQLELDKDARTVLDTLIADEKELISNQSEFFIQHIEPLTTHDKRIDGVIVSYMDITNLRYEQLSITREKQRLELLLKSTGIAIYAVDKEGRCTFVNNKFTQLTDFEENEVLGKNLHHLIHHTQKGGTPCDWTDCFVHQCLQDYSAHSGGLDIIWRKDGTFFSAEYSVEPVIKGNNLTGAVVVIRDITEELAHTERLYHLALHDSLTGLINRHEFENRLSRLLESAKKNNSKHILCFLDLDRFKAVNDNCGHLAGDKLLRQLTRLLGDQIRNRDTLARLGGDEFGVLIEHCDIEEGERISNQLRDVISQHRFNCEGKTYTVGVSIGMIAITKNSGEMNEVLLAADSACYLAKDNGRNQTYISEGK